MALVTGRMNTRRIINGIERTILIKVFTIKNTYLFSLIPPFLESTNIKARTIPISEPRTKDTNTMYKV